APPVARYRTELADLGARLGAEARRAEHLVRVAETCQKAVALSLLREAASVYEAGGDLASAKGAYFVALGRAADDGETTLELARALDPVLERLGLPAERCDVLERIVALESDPALRRAARAVLGRVAFEEL